MKIKEIQDEMERLERAIEPLQKKLSTLSSMLASEKSLEFIRANNIKKSDVELRDGDGKPWFSHISQFADWLKAQPTQKRFCEWNTIIYFTSDIVSGRLPYEMPGRIEDLKD